MTNVSWETSLFAQVLNIFLLHTHASSTFTSHQSVWFFFNVFLNLLYVLPNLDGYILTSCFQFMHVCFGLSMCFSLLEWHTVDGHCLIIRVHLIALTDIWCWCYQSKIDCTVFISRTACHFGDLIIIDAEQVHTYWRILQSSACLSVPAFSHILP